MAIQLTQQIVYRNLVQRAAVAGVLDRLHSGSFSRAKAALFHSTDRTEVMRAEAALLGRGSSRAYKAVADFYGVQNEVTGIAKQAGTTLSERMAQKGHIYVEMLVKRKLSDGSLTEEGAIAIRKELDSRVAQEYLSGFFAHLSMKAFTEPFSYAALYELSQGHIGRFFELAAIEVTPRQIYTITRMIRNHGKGIAYWRAFFHGFNPLPGGIVSYLFQMFGVSPRTSKMLLMTMFSNAGNGLRSLIGLPFRLVSIPAPQFPKLGSLLYRFCTAICEPRNPRTWKTIA